MIISKTPLRMSFVGGGSDLRAYYQKGYGAVVSTTIDKYLYVTVNRKFDDYIRVGYSKTEMVHNIRDIEHNIVREALKIVGGIEKQIDIVYMADVMPLQYGTGLGVSSSIAVGTLNALYAYKGQHVSAETLAEQACKIEIEILGFPVGKQDQYAMAYGGFNYIKFNSNETVFVDPVIFKKEIKEELNRKLLMFYIGMNCESHSVLTEQQRNTRENLVHLDKMVELAEELRSSLRNNNIANFGEILHKGWIYKQKLASKITNPRINVCYEKARRAGAIGGKILGSGGGGFLLFYCEEENHSKVRKALSDLREMQFKFEPQGGKIIYVSD